jgi:hypothetical protein
LMQEVVIAKVPTYIILSKASRYAEKKYSYD